MSERKVVTFPVVIEGNNGEVRLMFTKVDGVWFCKLEDEFMDDLQAAVAGKMPTERVRWVDIPNLGGNNEFGF